MLQNQGSPGVRSGSITHNSIILICINVWTRASTDEVNLFALVIFLTAVTLSGGNNLREEGVCHDWEGMGVGTGQPMATGA